MFGKTSLIKCLLGKSSQLKVFAWKDVIDKVFAWKDVTDKVFVWKDVIDKSVCLERRHLIKVFVRKENNPSTVKIDGFGSFVC